MIENIVLENTNSHYLDLVIPYDNVNDKYKITPLQLNLNLDDTIKIPININLYIQYDLLNNINNRYEKKTQIFTIKDFFIQPHVNIATRQGLRTNLGGIFNSQLLFQTFQLNDSDGHNYYYLPDEEIPFCNPEDLNLKKPARNMGMTETEFTNRYSYILSEKVTTDYNTLFGTNFNTNTLIRNNIGSRRGNICQFITVKPLIIYKSYIDEEKMNFKFTLIRIIWIINFKPNMNNQGLSYFLFDSPNVFNCSRIDNISYKLNILNENIQDQFNNKYEYDFKYPNQQIEFNIPIFPIYVKLYITDSENNTCEYIFNKDLLPIPEYNNFLGFFKLTHISNFFTIDDFINDNIHLGNNSRLVIQAPNGNYYNKFKYINFVYKLNNFN
jgi:hypothetical protein